MTSLHTFLHTQYGYVLGGGVCVSAHQCGSLLNHKVCVGCVTLRAHSLNRPAQQMQLTDCVPAAV